MPRDQPVIITLLLIVAVIAGSLTLMIWSAVEDDMALSTSKNTTHFSLYTEECSADFDGLCLNEGTFFYSPDAEGPACICREPYSGKRYQK